MARSRHQLPMHYQFDFLVSISRALSPKPRKCQLIPIEVPDTTSNPLQRLGRRSYRSAPLAPLAVEPTPKPRPFSLPRCSTVQLPERPSRSPPSPRPETQPLTSSNPHRPSPSCSRPRVDNTLGGASPTPSQSAGAQLGHSRVKVASS